MIEKVLESSIGASSGARWPSSCTCMKNHRSSVQAWRGYDCARLAQTDAGKPISSCLDNW